MEKLYFNTIIIGGGAAGMSAALSLTRAGISNVILEASAIGGQLNKTTLIENYPGIIMNGPDLALSFYEQLKSVGAKFVSERAIKIVKEDDEFKVFTEENNYYAKNIIIATGRVPRKLNVTGEEDFLNRGISFCALCDGNFFKNRDVVVIGGGDSALKEAIYLTNICKSVTVINRRDEFRGQKLLLDRLKEKDNVAIMTPYIVKEFKGDFFSLKEVLLENISTKEEKSIMCDGAFIYVGADPKLDFINNLDLEKDNNYLIVDSNYETNISNIFAVGDVIRKDLYQIVTAVNEGAIAANEIISREH